MATGKATATATAAMQSHVVAAANGSCNGAKTATATTKAAKVSHTHTRGEIMLAITFTCLDA